MARVHPYCFKSTGPLGDNSVTVQLKFVDRESYVPINDVVNKAIDALYIPLADCGRKAEDARRLAYEGEGAEEARLVL